MVHKYKPAYQEPSFDGNIYTILLRIFIVSLLSIPMTGIAQVPKKALKYFNEANYDIGLNQYDLAKEKLMLAVKAYPDYEKAHLYLADIYYQEKDYAAALDEYHWVKNSGSHPGRVELFMSRIYFAVRDFTASVSLVDEYLSNENITDKARLNAELLRKNALFSEKAIAEAWSFLPVNLGIEVNSKNSEYLPSMNADESTVIFTRKIRGQEDLFVTGVDNGKWLEAVPIDEGTINTGHNEGAHCISSNGKLLFYTICNERNTRGSCDLYISKRQQNGWSAPLNLGPPLNSVAWDSQPSLSADGKTLYFVSNRRGGFGGKDIWMSRWENGLWKEPLNLGPAINTPHDEQTPFIHFDNETLYFSSDGHPGMGKQDIYFSRFRDGQWMEPVNLGYPFNTQQVESGLNISLDGKKAYYAAERDDGFGELDIYEFELPPFARPNRVTYVRAKIVDKQTGKPVETEFVLQDLGDKKVNITNTAIDGEFLICLPSGSDYSLHIKEDGYLLESFHFSLKDTVERKAFTLKIEIEAIETGQSVVLRNVFFETDSYDLLPESFSELEELYHFLIKHPDVNLEISGHTDNRGSRAYNMTLSLQRAQSVVSYLNSKGFDEGRLSAKGYGPDLPIADNSTRAGQAENRRTEFKILP